MRIFGNGGRNNRYFPIRSARAILLVLCYLERIGSVRYCLLFFRSNKHPVLICGKRGKENFIRTNINMHAIR